MQKSIKQIAPKRILIRSTNWIGDAIMTTPAVRSIRENFPDAEISILAYPWVADIFRACPHIDRVILYEKRGRHHGLAGLWRLARELAVWRFDLALLLQNAFEAALLTLLAGIPARAGYRRDGRALLLTHGVRISPEIRAWHQVHYYQGLLAELGLACGPDQLCLTLPEEAERRADLLLAEARRPLIGLNPGAAYGPAKCWPVARYAELAACLAREEQATLLVFGTPADQDAARQISEAAPGKVLDLTGKTSLAEAMALIGRCDCFVTNDSGLMHVAAALATPTVAIFGSTDSVATGPFSPVARVIRHEIACSPCFATHCRRNDFACMKGVSVAAVCAATRETLAAG